MAWIKAGSAAVIVASRFNPSILNQGWLMKHGVLKEGDLEQGSVFLDMLVQVRSRSFFLQALPEQLQVVPSGEIHGDGEQELLLEKLGKIVEKLSETPYKGPGLNFSWHLVPSDGDTSKVTRALFFVPGSPMYQAFDTADARFGGFLSKDFSRFRLKLDIKPIVVAEGETQQHRVHFGFNFHFDLGDDAARQINERLSRWNEVRLEAERIIDTIEPRDKP